MKKTVIGILAHVDAGKTTLSESMLYTSGSIRKMGRVDHGDAFLDYDVQERTRGITIFSKEANFTWKDIEITLIDTPGHVDFSTEMERTLQILDYAILVINALDGVQIHTKTIWNLLRHYKIPTFIFINKMDMNQVDKEAVKRSLKNDLDEACIDFSQPLDTFYEQVALIDEMTLEYYLEHNEVTKKMIAQGIKNQKIVPCHFGSALKMEGVDTFLDSLSTYIIEKEYPKDFGARVYKISRDEQGNKLTHMKIIGGRLKVKSVLKDNEKVDQIRQYSGNKYATVSEVYAGEVCAIKGLHNMYPGEGIGNALDKISPVLSSYLSYRVILPDTCDEFTMLKYLQQLSQEDPQLHIRYQEQSKDIYIQLMGEVQIEVLKNIIKNRFDVDISFDHGSIIYKETITNAVEGIGHYEPLKHYAEVHLLLEPGKHGSGLQFYSNCKEDDLHRNYQRLILSHLKEKEHIGVLTGSPITDMKITLLIGKAHQKHTEGGDFRQATYRAVRQGLKSTASILLEPQYQFRLEIPSEYMSKAIYDIEQMKGQFILPEDITETIIIEGTAPVSKMQDYATMVTSYTKGKGRLYCTLKGYEPCHNQQEVIDEIAYNSENDIDNPTSSIFCSHGAGYAVTWDKVREYMHVDSGCGKPKKAIMKSELKPSITISETELENIFTRTYGSAKHHSLKSTPKSNTENSNAKAVYRPECLLVDGYNVIYAWESLKTLAKENLDAARMKLMDVMCNYQGYKQAIVIIVFDAYKVKGNPGTVEKYDNIFIIYTKEAQTADAYIERVTHELGNTFNIIVATSDALEQVIVVGRGARRISSRELEIEVEYINQQQIKEYERKNTKGHNYLLEDMKSIDK
ncbi:MAG: NYN domain-containing protein [Coprobacillaceae bacterium]